ncbi:MAG: hypothetical protein MHPSP_003240, partial [Paramarteilia canceri]
IKLSHFQTNCELDLPMVKIDKFATNKQDQVNENALPAIQSTDKIQACPICKMDIFENLSNFEINQHIDECLNQETIMHYKEKSPKKIKIDFFTKRE